MNAVSQHSASYISGRSWRSGRPDELFDKSSYDLAILASSWDSRSVSLTECRHVKADEFLVLLFDCRDAGGLRDNHDDRLATFARDHGSYVPLNGPSTEVSVIWRELEKRLLEARRTRRHPLRILVDISTCPRYFLLGVLSLVFRERLIHTLSMFYAEGLYPEVAGRTEIAFTGEKWQVVPAPGFEGTFSPGKHRFYLVSAGFEGRKALRILTRADPDRVSLLFPEPGVIQEYIARTRCDNQALIEQFAVPEDHILKAQAGDAIGAWQVLSTLSPELPESENCYYLCCGTKPHSVALGLRALSLKHPAVLYALPDEHKIVPVSPAGVYWRFDMEDITAIPSN